MVLPLVALLLQAPPAPADGKIVRVWLDTDSPLRRGSAVRVYVEAVQDGNLVVLHRRTDGRIDVLFPGKPTEDPFVRLGTYEIRGSGDRPGLVVAEPDGTGMILAALSPDPLRFNEFVRFADWNADALAPTWNGTDAEGSLSDIVQRMLGDGALNYDLVTYTVAPPVYALQDTTPRDTATGYATFPPCPGCTYIGEEFVVYGADAFCDLFWDTCLASRRFRRQSPCDAGSTCMARPQRALAYTGARLGPPPAALLSARAQAPSASARAPARVPAVVPRPRGRAPVAAAAGGALARATPLVPGRRREPTATMSADRVHTRAASHAGATGLEAPISHVRFTLTSAPVAAAPPAVRLASRSGEPLAEGPGHAANGSAEGGVSVGGGGGGARWSGGGSAGRGVTGASRRTGAHPAAPAAVAAARAEPGARATVAPGARALAQPVEAMGQVALRRGAESRGGAARAPGGRR